jgi:endo-1,4-beta-mannosidase
MKKENEKKHERFGSRTRSETNTLKVIGELKPNQVNAVTEHVDFSESQSQSVLLRSSADQKLEGVMDVRHITVRQLAPRPSKAK